MGSMDKFYLTGINRRNNPDGTITVHCKQCGRPVMRAAGVRVRTISKCQVCILTEQGVLNAEQLVKPKYLLTDPTMPPIPLDAEDPVYILYPEEALRQGEKIPPSGGVFGTAKSFFRALGLALDDGLKIVMPSKRVAKRQRAGGLYEKDDEDKEK